MSGDAADPAPDAEIRRAFHLARGVFSDAMREHGLLSGVIRLIDARAERILDELLAVDDDPEPGNHATGEETK
ncbi:hypothetical protein AB0L06_09205 [Spirillospora sp. NPDC052269]